MLNYYLGCEKKLEKYILQIQTVTKLYFTNQTAILIQIQNMLDK